MLSNMISSSSQFFVNKAFLLVFWCIQIITCFSLVFVFNTNSVFQVATAQQQPSLGSSTLLIKGLLADANQTLNSGNTTKTLQNLLTVQRLMAQINDNSSSIQVSKLLIRDIMKDIIQGRTDIASTKLSLCSKSCSNILIFSFSPFHLFMKFET
jgi:hypothetical protein